MGQVSGVAPGGSVDPAKGIQEKQQVNNIQSLKEIDPPVNKPTGLVRTLQIHSPQQFEGIKSIEEDKS